MSERSPGFEEYTPSRLEWLAVHLNTFTTYITFGVRECEVLYVPGEDGRTLILRISYPSDADMKRVNHYIENAKKLAKDMAKVYNWDSWLEFEIKIDQDYH